MPYIHIYLSHIQNLPKHDIVIWLSTGMSVILLLLSKAEGRAKAKGNKNDITRAYEI